ncbi:MAG: hypothetical protein ABIT37_03345 [Luteolibacter sp.]
MKLSNITIVALRLFAIYRAGNAVIGILALLGNLHYIGESFGTLGFLGYLILAPVMDGLFAWLAWRFAEPISRRVVGSTDPNVEFQHITAENLYTAAALCMGLYFSLSRFPDLLLWIYYIVADKTGHPIIPQQGGVKLYQISFNALLVVAGVALVFMASTIGKRLAETGSLWGKPKGGSADGSSERR